MSTTERKAALEAAREAWPGVLMNNVSSTCLADVMELLRHSHQQSQTAEVGASSSMCCSDMIMEFCPAMASFSAMLVCLHAAILHRLPQACSTCCTLDDSICLSTFCSGSEPGSHAA